MNALRVLLFYGGDDASHPRDALLAWLRGHDVGLDARVVADAVPHSNGAVDDRVDRAITWADAAIAILTPDPRSPGGALNVIDEIGRWRGGRGKDSLLLLRREGVEPYSNLNGVVYVAFKDRISETFEGVRRFLANLSPDAEPSTVLQSPLGSQLSFFLHFLNVEILAYYNVRYTFSLEQIATCAESVVRCLLILTDLPIHVPVAAIYENPIAFRLSERLADLRDIGMLSYGSPTKDLERYEEKKIGEYSDDPVVGPIYRSPTRLRRRRALFRGMIFCPRVKYSASAEIAECVESLIVNEGDPVWRSCLQERRRTGSSHTLKLLHHSLRKLTERLGNEAFILRNVVRTLDATLTPREQTVINQVLNYGFVSSMIKEYDLTIPVDIDIGAVDVGFLSAAFNEARSTLSIRRLRNFLRFVGLETAILSRLPILRIHQLRSTIHLQVIMDWWLSLVAEDPRTIRNALVRFGIRPASFSNLEGGGQGYYGRVMRHVERLAGLIARSRGLTSLGGRARVRDMAQPRRRLT